MDKTTEKTTEKITGFIGQDAAIKELANKSKVVNLDVAIAAIGETKAADKPVWVKTAFWNDLAESAKEIKKGQRITIEGEKKVNINDKGGVTYTNEYIEVKNFSLSNYKDLTGELSTSPELKTINGSDALEFSIKDKESKEHKVVLFKDVDNYKNLKQGDKFSFKGEEKISFYKTKDNELKQNTNFIAKEDLSIVKDQKKDKGVSMS